MQFKHPELLYALFLLLIPIIIHLFQLRRFQKVDFTNVAFLKKVTIQTRKSSQLKKWLTLLMRLLALACVIFAFAQPFTASKTALNTKKETVLYIDNSFSMEAKGAKGPMLQRTLQEVYEQVEGTDKINWFTNSSTHKAVLLQDFKAEVLKTPFTQTQLTPAQILLKANQLFSNDPEATKRLVIISDFQQKESFPEKEVNIEIDAVQLKPLATANISIDSVFIASKNTTGIQLKAKISAQGDTSGAVPVSLYQGTDLIAKTAADLSKNKQTTITFDVENTGDFKGVLQINDAYLSYDNLLHFSLNASEKIKVLSINEANANFLERIFGQDEFDYVQQTFGNLNYNIIPTQNFIVLNELKEIPASLNTALQSFVSNGGSLFVIPSEASNLTSYNRLLNSLGMGSFSERKSQEKQITQIVFDHPLYRDVFEKRVVNFQYPKVNSYFTTSSNAATALKFEDGSPFLLQHQTIYVSTAAYNDVNSNFKNSPLIVPTLYNMAQQSLPLPKLYYQIGKQNTFSVPVTLSQDAILTLRDSTNRFIPLQHTKANQVNITTSNLPDQAATYAIEKENDFLQWVSYNYDRSESVLQYADPTNWEGVTVYDGVEELFDTIRKDNNINSFWKWFVILALLFLLLEMLILKFYR